MPANLSLTAQALAYIENNLNAELNLTNIAAELHYSKFHLHRIFCQNTGLTIHAYAQRRRMTEAARLLAGSARPVIDIALASGFASQQAFSGCFKALYKASPAEFRARRRFYPLQLPIQLAEQLKQPVLGLRDIKTARLADVPDWLELTRQAIDGYPCLEEANYLRKIKQYIVAGQALILRADGLAVGLAAFSDAGSIDFWAVHPQYRRQNISQLLLAKLRQDLLPGQALSLTTYRQGDKADTGYRAEYQSLGFQPAELLEEFGYPTQRLVLPFAEARQ